ncbi:unnamed protein product [Sphenostylis stenocarpa]|uniref:Uncharacterized protein n=1 Tax=Sphenostylis stenocarpa TaxID=92480 RepID=A0AA86S0Z4_9FABA|nr:unnamed protein product [Sphenostylis stenocarpa]
MVDVFWLQVDHHDPENSSLFRFNALWEAHYHQDSLLVFSTGRSPTLYKQLRKEKPMITPDIAIMSVGTEITYGKSMVPDDGWVQFLNYKWDKNIVIEESSKFPELKHQVSNAQEELLQWHSQNAKDSPKILHASERCAYGIIRKKAKEKTNSELARTGDWFLHSLVKARGAVQRCLFQTADSTVDAVECPVNANGGICGHVAHMECALECFLAGKVRSLGRDGEYYCRRCDGRSNMISHVYNLIQT